MSDGMKDFLLFFLEVALAAFFFTEASAESNLFWRGAFIFVGMIWSYNAALTTFRSLLIQR